MILHKLIGLNLKIHHEYEDNIHNEKIIVALFETDRLMKKIDEIENK